MNKLIVVRGLPGSGKSTIAKRMSGYIHLEGDMFRTTKEGKYVYDPCRSRDAIGWVIANTKYHLYRGDDVVVCGVLPTAKTLHRLFEVAENYKALIEVITATYDGVSSHNVPEVEMEKLRSKWVATPSYLERYDYRV